MSWKPLPHEHPAKEKQKKTHVRASLTRRTFSKKPPKTSYRLLQSVSVRLHEFVKKEGKYSTEEMADLITDMQRGVINLQRKRSELLEKKKNKTLKKNQFKVKKIK